MSYVDIALVFAGFLAAVFGGDPIVQLVLGRLEQGMPKEMRNTLEQGSIPNAGRYIGYLERSIVFLLAMDGQLTAIAFVLAAKAIVRFESAKERAFAEFFLVGTFTSVLIAVAIAMIILSPPISRWR